MGHVSLGKRKSDKIGSASGRYAARKKEDSKKIALHNKRMASGEGVKMVPTSNHMRTIGGGVTTYFSPKRGDKIVRYHDHWDAEKRESSKDRHLNK